MGISSRTFEHLPAGHLSGMDYPPSVHPLTWQVNTICKWCFYIAMLAHGGQLFSQLLSTWWIIPEYCWHVHHYISVSGSTWMTTKRLSRLCDPPTESAGTHVQSFRGSSHFLTPFWPRLFPAKHMDEPGWTTKPLQPWLEAHIFAAPKSSKSIGLLRTCSFSLLQPGPLLWGHPTDCSKLTNFLGG